MENDAVTLGYWDMRGLCERVRLLLEYLAIPYKEVRFAGSEGRTKWFNEIKPQLFDKNPAITLPYLIDGQKAISECDAICVHLCCKSKPQLLGRNTEEQVALATAQGVYREIYPNYIRLVYGDYTKKMTFQQALSESIEGSEHYLKKMNGLLAEKQFIAGGITWFDFALADFLQTLSLLHHDYLKPFPKLIEYYQRIWGLEELKDYFGSGRFKERPCNNYTAAWK